jgi:hypothetical protein
VAVAGDLVADSKVVVAVAPAVLELQLATVYLLEQTIQ